MRVKIHPDSVVLWASARDTYDWAHRPGNAWPCSELSGHRFCAEFDSTGLVDLTVDGAFRDVDGVEFSACASDLLRDRVPSDHPAYFVAVGQFGE